MRVKEKTEKADLKLSIQKTKTMASDPITLWQIEGGRVEADFIFLGSKITVDGDCSPEIKRQLLLGRKAMTNLKMKCKSISRSVMSNSETARWPSSLLCPRGFFRQEHWSGLPCPLPGDPPNPGIEPTSLMSPASAGEFLPLAPLGEPEKQYTGPKWLRCVSEE